MKLFLMRHASAEDKVNEEDISRSLTQQGIKEASAAAEFLQNYKIDKMLVSPAKRTKQTAEIIQNRVSCTNCEIVPELYASSVEKLIEIISYQEDKDKTILVIAHNPGIFKTSLSLLNLDSLEYEELIEKGMPPANIVSLDFADLQSWEDIYKNLNHI